MGPINRRIASFNLLNRAIILLNNPFRFIHSKAISESKYNQIIIDAFGQEREKGETQKGLFNWGKQLVL